MEHAFGRGEPFKVGVEEELLLVDPRTHALKHHASELLAKLGDRIKPDLYEAEVETASPVVRDRRGGGRARSRRRAPRCAGPAPR